MTLSFGSRICARKALRGFFGSSVSSANLIVFIQFGIRPQNSVAIDTKPTHNKPSLAAQAGHCECQPDLACSLLAASSCTEGGACQAKSYPVFIASQVEGRN